MKDLSRELLQIRTDDASKQAERSGATRRESPMDKEKLHD
jgi:hypothetical protein